MKLLFNLFKLLLALCLIGFAIPIILLVIPFVLLAMPIGLAVLGYWMFHKSRRKPSDSESGLAEQDLQVMLEDLIKRTKKQVSPPVFKKLVNIRDNLLVLLPSLDKVPLGDYDLHVVKNTVTDYLPQTLSTYLELQPEFARTHKMRNGKTAEEIFIEQLDILDEQIQKILINVESKNAEALIAQGEFLKSKFADDKDWL